jgi:hypothetical protein
MKGVHQRYAVVACASSVGVAAVLAVLLGALAFVTYMALYLLAYASSPVLHETIWKIANGRDEEE